MTIKERIIEVMKESPHASYTSSDIRDMLGRPPINSINWGLKQLVGGGVLTKTPDPSFEKRMLYQLIDYQRKTKRKPNENQKIRKLLLYTLIENEISQENDRFHPLLAEVDNLIQKFLNEGGKKLLVSVPDDVVKKIDAIISEQILPLLRSPVLETTDAPAVDAPFLDPPTEEVPPLTKFSTRKHLETAFGGSIPGTKKGTKSPKATTPKEEAAAKRKANALQILRKKEARIDATPFGPHIRYYKLTPGQRNLEFARAWHKVLMKFFPGVAIKRNYDKALASLTQFQADKEFYNQLWKARIEADLLCCRYEDYHVGIAEYYFDRNAKGGREKSPLPGVLAGEIHVAAAKDYLDLGLKGKILITPQDIRHSGNADFILNYGSATSEQQDLATIFYHDVLFIELERAAFLSGYRLFDLVTYTITYGMMPQSWAEGYRTEHNLEQLKSYHFPGPVDPPGALFRHIQE